MQPFVRDNLTPVLRGRRVLVGVTGSIAAFKACDIVRDLRACGAEVRVVLTANAARFVTPLTLETLSGQPVLTSLWDGGHGTHHIDTARWADVALVAPATANTIAKLSHGLADDLLTTELLAFTGPTFIAPAMNPAMYAHPATQANVKLLSERGTRILGPTTGATACGELGEGRMLESQEIVEAMALGLAKPTGPRRKILISLGPTRSPIDPVRYVTNRSSGLMGAALAWAAALAGHEVVALCGPTSVRLPSSARRLDVETAADLHAAALELWPSCDAYIGAAAVLDWDVANPSPRKLKKERGEAPALEFARNADVLADLAARARADQRVVGFAAETDSPLDSGRAKLAAKGCHAIFVNDVSRAGLGFESERNAGWWLARASNSGVSGSGAPSEPVTLDDQPKPELARRLIDLTERTFARAPETSSKNLGASHDRAH